MDPVTFRSRRRLRWRVPLVIRVMRRRFVWWAITGAVAVVAAVSIGNIYDQAERNRDAWGEPVTVFVATSALEPGTAIEDQFVAQQWPQALVPDQAITNVDPAAIVVAPILEGEPLVEPRLSGNRTGLSARIPEGRSAVAVSSVVIPAGLSVGDRVDLVATFPAGANGNDGVIASRAVVIEVTDDQVSVAVEPDEVESTAAAITRGTLTMLVQGS